MSSLMSMTFLKTLLFVNVCYVAESQQYNATIFSTTSTHIGTAHYAPVFIFGMIISGVCGMIIISLFAIHSLYHFIHQTINTGLARWLYVSFYSFNLITCFAYTFFKVDFILPLGTVIDCRIGTYLRTNGVFISKFILFLVFIFRIDVAFHDSALAYPRKLLITIVVTYAIYTCIGNAMYIYTTYPVVTFMKTLYFNNSFEIGVCTIDLSHDADTLTLILGILTFGDVIYSILVCFLFIYKLNKVVKMSESSCNSQSASRDNKLKKVMKKQTILVLLAVVSSLLLLGVGGAFASSGATLLMPIDAIVNTFCVWLMFNFADPIWNKIIHCCCCCCYCANKDNLLMTLHTMSRAISFKSRSEVVSNMSNNLSNTSNRTEQSKDKDKDIKIDFENAKNITLDKKFKKETHLTIKNTNSNNNKSPRSNKKSELEIPLTSEDEDIKYDENPSTTTTNEQRKSYGIELQGPTNLQNNKSVSSVVVDDESHSSDESYAL